MYLSSIIKLIVFILTLTCANTLAQVAAPRDPRAKARAKGTRTPSRNITAPNCSHPEARPLPDGAPKGAGDGLQMKLDGTITGDVAFVSIDVGGNPKPVTDDMKLAITKELKYIEELWYTQASEVYACGQKLKIRPVLKPSFIDSYQSIPTTDGLNIVYIFSDCITVGDVTPCNDPPGPVGKDAWGYHCRPVNWWTNEIEPRRGKGILPAFTFAMVDPVLPAKHEPGRWGRAFAHEFGHALGLWDTYNPLKPDEPDSGLMGYQGGTDILPGYVAELFTRVFECRIDVTASFNKTSLLPSEEGKGQWGFIGKLTYKWEGVLTSGWAYFDGAEGESNRNRCNVRNKKEELRKYHMCDADKISKTSDEIDILPLSSPLTPGVPPTPITFAWQWETINPTVVENAFSDESGKCKSPFAAKANSAKLDLLLAGDGQKAWLAGVSGRSDSTFSTEDPDPEREPDCKYYGGPSSLEGERIEASTMSSAPELRAESKLKQGNAVVGTFTVNVKMALGKKGGP